MIKAGIIKVDQVIFVYSQPSEKSLIGVVNNIDYPIVTINVVQRSVKNKFGKIEKIDISKNIALTILTEEFLKDYLTPKEMKRLKKIQKDSEMIDLFEGTY